KVTALIACVSRGARQLNVINDPAVGARDASPFQRVSDAPREARQTIQIGESQFELVITCQEEPIASPGDIAGNRARSADFEIAHASQSITWHVLDRDASLAVIFEPDDADRRLQTM